MIQHPTPQTPEDMEREALGTIISVCRDIERSAEDMDVAGVKTHYNFLRTVMGRLDVIRNTVQQRPRSLYREGKQIGRTVWFAGRP